MSDQGKTGRGSKSSQADKGARFLAMHQAEGAFLMPNPWDVGSTVILEKMGYQALGTTSAGYAFSTGRPDGGVTFEQVLDHLSTISQATDLPVSADLEALFADSPEKVYQNVLLAAARGIVGASIQDSSDGVHSASDSLLPASLAQDRVFAAAEARNALGFTFTLTARTECFTLAEPSLDESIRRLKLYEEAGADVLFVPWLKTYEEIKEVLSAVSKPVSVMLGLPNCALNVQSLSALGVKRISTGASLARAAYSALLTSASEIQRLGTFDYADNCVTGKAFNSLFSN